MNFANPQGTCGTSDGQVREGQKETRTVQNNSEYLVKWLKAEETWKRFLLNVKYHQMLGFFDVTVTNYFFNLSGRTISHFSSNTVDRWLKVSRFYFVLLISCLSERER